MGVGEASGMFPIDSDRVDYCTDMLDQFSTLIADRGYPLADSGHSAEGFDGGPGCGVSD